MLIFASHALIENTEIISPAYIFVENGTITGIFDAKPDTTKQPSVELHNTLLLPGFINAHCHLEFTATGPLTEKRFVPWIESIVTHPRPDDKTVLAGIQKGLKDLALSGVTTVCDHINSQTPLQAHNDSPLTIIGFGEVLGTDYGRAQSCYKDLQNKKEDACFDFHLTPHATHSVHPRVLEQLWQHKEQNPFSIHTAESFDETLLFEQKMGLLAELLQKRVPQGCAPPNFTGYSALQVLQNQGYDLSNTLVIHGNYLTEQDINTVKESKLCVVHCPGCFAFFNHQNGFDYELLKANNIPIALGTDSLASNTQLNFLHEIQIFLEKYPQKDLEEFIPLVTTNSIQALGLSKMGMLKTGYRADIIGLPHSNAQDPLKAFTTNQAVSFSMAKGQILDC